MLTGMDKIKITVSSILAVASIGILKVCFVKTDGHGIAWAKDNLKVFICMMVILLGTTAYHFWMYRKIKK